MPILDKNGQEYIPGVKKPKQAKSFVSEVKIHKIESPELNYKLVELNCLPFKETYQNPIKINVFISKSTDIIFECWTKTSLDKGSILHQMVERRWWEIKEILLKDNWFKYNCLPSCTCPNFMIS